MTQRISCPDGAHRDQAVASALAAVRRGDLVLIPTESVYAIAADAFSARGMEALREAKGYDPSTPVPVMVGRRATVAGIAARISTEARALMEGFWPGELTVLLTAQPSLAWDQPSDHPLAVRMPLHPLALALLAQTGPLAVTSANVPGLPAPIAVDDALEQVGEAVALALDAGELAGAQTLPSTIVDARSAPPRIVRSGALSAESIRRVCPSVLPEDADEGA